MVQTALKLRNLTVDLPPGADRAHAVEDVSLDVNSNEILCVVGESGSGKSIMGRTVMGLLGRTRLKPSAGRVLFGEENLLTASPARMRQIRGDRISMVFQEPMTALNPLMTVGRQINELLKIHRTMSHGDRKKRVHDLFASVLLPDPERIYASYPHQLSGGQRQRAVIAMALILEPDVVIADEPTTALDVTTQAQILKLIKNDYTRTLLEAVPRLVPRAKCELTNPENVLAVRDLSKTFGARRRFFRRARRGIEAVKSVSLALRRGETLGIVGESGSGKSTLARCVVRL